MSYLKNRKNAFVYAFSGLFLAFKKERNLQLQCIIAAMVVVAGFYFDIGQLRWVAVGGCITLVITLELLNSAIEKTCDLYSQEQDPRIKYIKDISAAAVLITCIFACIIGGIVFFPYLFERFF